MFFNKFSKTKVSTFLGLLFLLNSCGGGGDDHSFTPENNLVSAVEIDSPKSALKSSNSIQIFNLTNTVTNCDNVATHFNIGKCLGKDITIKNIKVITNLSNQGEDKDGAIILNSNSMMDYYNKNFCYIGQNLKTGESCKIAVKFLGNDSKDNNVIVSSISVETDKDTIYLSDFIKLDSVEEAKKDILLIPDNHLKFSFADEWGNNSNKIIPNSFLHIEVRNLDNKSLNYCRIILLPSLKKLVSINQSKLEDLGELKKDESFNFYIKFKDFDNLDIPKKDLKLIITGSNIKKDIKVYLGYEK